MDDPKARAKVALAGGCAAFAFTYIITATFFPVNFLADSDTFLHISLGNLILQSGHFPTVDQFSYTAFGKVWLATDWIPELAFAALYKVAQWRGVTEIVAVTCALISGALCYTLAKHLRLSIALGLTAIIVVLISPHFLARPVVVSYLLILVWIVVILEMEDQGKWGDRRGFILIPLMLLWANIHGSFTFGLVVFYLFLGNAIWNSYRNGDLQSFRSQVVLLAGVSVAALVTPYGPFPALKTFQLMSTSALSAINEWRAPDFQRDPFHLAWIVGLFALLVYFGIRLRGPRLLTLLLVTVFALEHKRGLGLFSMVAPLLLLRPLTTYFPWVGIQDHANDPLLRFANRRSGTIGLACAAVVVVAGITIWTTGPQVRPAPEVMPEKAVAAAMLAGVKGNVLNTYGFGGYLIFMGIPTFVDGRVELYGNQFLQDYFDAMALAKPDAAARILKQYDVRWALLRPGEPIAFMLKADGWEQLYSDRSAIVLAKKP